MQHRCGERLHGGHKNLLTMAMRPITSVSPESIQLENIYLAVSGLTFGKDTAARIVGGVRRLETLISEGKIAADKTARCQNGKWYCNAADVLRHCRNMRTK
ncbi:MAG: hypothetical protein NC411_00220 [Bacteroides sp.]|nr:hypothetical protein [Bacteroides sp.]